MKTKHTLIDVSKLKTIKRDEGGGEGGYMDVVATAVGAAMALVRRWWGDDVVVVVTMGWWGRTTRWWCSDGVEDWNEDDEMVVSQKAGVCCVGTLERGDLVIGGADDDGRSYEGGVRGWRHSEEVVIEEVAEKKISTADSVTTAGEVVTTASIKVTTTSAPTTTKTITTAQPSSKDKGEGKMVEPENPLKKKDQIALDEECAFRLHAEEQAELERVQRERDAQEEASRAAVIKELDQAMIEADEQLAVRLQIEEQEQFSIEQKSRMLVEMIAERKRFFAAQKAAEQRSKPPTKAQIRNRMCTYLKNMDGYKHNQLKGRSYEEILKLFDKIYQQVNTFVPMDSDVVEGLKKAKADTEQESNTKRACEELEHEKAKKQSIDEHVEEEKESEGLNQCFEIVPEDGDDVTIDATPLSTRSPNIMYLTFVKMLKNFNREDLEVLWNIVKDRFKKTEPENYMDNYLLLTLKTMFEHHFEDTIWKKQQGLTKVNNWKLFDSCGVYCVTIQSLQYYLLVEKKYPLTYNTLHQMFNDVKLQVDYECEMDYELLRLVKRQLKEGYVPE
ncbi:hypothetical protein Tco_0225961 [Tanacetum coccineum]